MNRKKMVVLPPHQAAHASEACPPNHRRGRTSRGAAGTPHDLDRACGMKRNRLRYRAEHATFDRSVSMRAHDDEIRPPSLPLRPE